MQTKYKKSDTCVICGEKLFNGKRDGNFLCWKCRKEIEDEILNLLKYKSEYKDNVEDVSLVSTSSWGSSQKTMIIKVKYNYGRNIYIRISTSKVLDINDLNDNDLLVNYLDSEIKVQYALQGNRIEKEIEELKERVKNSEKN